MIPTLIMSNMGRSTYVLHAMHHISSPLLHERFKTSLTRGQALLCCCSGFCARRASVTHSDASEELNKGLVRCFLVCVEIEDRSIGRSAYVI